VFLPLNNRTEEIISILKREKYFHSRAIRIMGEPGTPRIPALGRQRVEDSKLEAILSYTTSPYLQTK
jgi:hypothetical protein